MGTTVAHIVSVMRQSNDEGVFYDRQRGTWTTLGSYLREHGATAQQAAKAARRLGWASTSVDDWSDVLEDR